jgi:hypothetical protein
MLKAQVAWSASARGGARRTFFSAFSSQPGGTRGGLQKRLARPELYTILGDRL